MLFAHRYLNERLLDECVAALEDGLRQSDTERSTGTRSGAASVDIKIARASGSLGADTESAVTKGDHAAARFRRLREAGHQNPSETGWVEVTQPDIDFKSVGIGAFIEWECDIFIPPALEALTNFDQIRSSIRMMNDLMPLAKTFDLGTEGMPEPDQIDAMDNFLKNTNIQPVIVGEDSSTDWKIIGTLDRQWIRDETTFDDRVITTAKVKRSIQQGRWYPIMSLPGMNLLNRAERRQMEKEGPKDDSEKEQFIQGPVLLVDYLALSS